jgi:hypothetical protein
MTIDARRPAEVQRALGDANRLAAAGNTAAAVQRLQECNRSCASYELERRIIGLRRKAFQRRARAPCTLPANPTRAAPLDAARRVPLAERSKLSAELIGDTLAAHGALVVPRLFDTDQTRRLAALVDKAFDARRAARNHKRTDQDRAWFEEVSDIAPLGRHFLGDQGMYICDSPRGLFDFLEVYRQVGLLELLPRYFGERVALMPEKCTLRKVVPWSPAEWSHHRQTFGDEESTLLWHQDGRIFGEATNALDIWIALSPCGRDAPGLELVPSRVNRLLPLDASRGFGTVAPRTIRRELPDVEPVLPEFEPGDALFMDQFTLHSTGHRRGMEKVRVSVEAWFFGESAYPHNGDALLVCPL